MNASPGAATADASPDAHAPLATSRALVPRLSDRLVDDLVEQSLDDGRDARPGRATRADGWTPEAIRAFLDALAEHGCVADAARAAGMTRKSAYRLRARAEGRAFALAWAAALRLARQRLADDVMSRAVHGCVEYVKRGDDVIERHRFDNRLTMAVLARLDRQVAEGQDEDRLASLVAGEFEQFAALAARGGDEAADFLAARLPGGRRVSGLAAEVELLRRAGNFRRYGVGLPGEIDVSDLDPAQMADWTDEQAERAERSGFLADLARREEEEERKRQGMIFSGGRWFKWPADGEVPAA